MIPEATEAEGIKAPPQGNGLFTSFLPLSTLGLASSVESGEQVCIKVAQVKPRPPPQLPWQVGPEHERCRP